MNKESLTDAQLVEHFKSKIVCPYCDNCLEGDEDDGLHFDGDMILCGYECYDCNIYFTVTFDSNITKVTQERSNNE